MTLAEAVRRVLDRRLVDLHVAMPGRIERYDAATQKADVKPIIREMREEDDDEFESFSIPIIPSVPVVMPGGGGYRGTFPIAKGDTVLLVFSELPLDSWLQHGGTDVDPRDPSRNQLTDAIAIAGLHPFSSPWTGVPTDAATWGKDGGAQVVARDNTLHLGGDNLTELVAIASRVEQQLTTLKNAIDTAVVVAQDGGASFKSTLMAKLAAWPSSVGSSSVKVKP